MSILNNTLYPWHTSSLMRQEDFAQCGLSSITAPATCSAHPVNLTVTHIETHTTILHAQRDMATDYVDLVLLHYSMCWGQLCGTNTQAFTWVP